MGPFRFDAGNLWRLDFWSGKGRFSLNAFDAIVRLSHFVFQPVALIFLSQRMDTGFHAASYMLKKCFLLQFM